jgi:hypothetical protein
MAKPSENKPSGVSRQLAKAGNGGARVYLTSKSEISKWLSLGAHLLISEIARGAKPRNIQLKSSAKYQAAAKAASGNIMKMKICVCGNEGDGVSACRHRSSWRQHESYRRKQRINGGVAKKMASRRKHLLKISMKLASALSRSEAKIISES